ncbi:MAG TPA: hypothetical protein VFS76_25990 [Pyrinomonadaceae bacterium]|nr:hypothetical protein [Pyrinomonadaceae bacterium]
MLVDQAISPTTFDLVEKNEEPKNLYRIGLSLSLLFVISCSYKPKEAEAPKEFAAMLAKKDKLAALPTTEKLAKKPR